MIRSFYGKHPRIASSAFISEGAYIVGDVEIGEGSNVWPGAVIRGDTGRIVIGKNVAIEDGVVVHAGVPPYELLTIEDNVNIGHNAVIHGVRIGQNTLIGMNATVLQQAAIGSFCLVGANSLVTEGMEIPDNSFVIGSPAEVKGPVREDQMYWLRDVPGSYAELARQYKAAGLDGW